ncbi:syndecan isoform X1 [Drosophila subpulchrella]|uniref:syndecan isoform X1 n=1 Tax=Drosophila subpulchrella TaxID=1486046 RepID=UPI0018A168D6|nr:syndecan isoform X1 [Drosophila subpulchrella]XP_037712520.1 syndecan isoform X1 [Drosophila subpulchrella]
MKPKQKISVEPLLLLAILLGILVVATHAQDQKIVKPSAAAPSPAASRPRDEIYIDDDSNEGSGGHGGIHEDLEKEPDYSGSGFGPDDEDAEPDQHSHSSHNTRISQNGNAGINTAHTPTLPSSTISTTSSSTPTPTTTTTTTTAATTTTTTTSTTQQPSVNDNTTTTTTTAPTIPTSTQPNQPIFPPFDKDLDSEASGDGNDSDIDDNEDDDLEDTEDYNYNKELDGIDIDGPGSVPQQPSIPENTDGDDRIFTTDEIDVDGADEDEVVDFDVGGPRIGGNDGDITERGPGAGGSNVHELDPNTNVNSQPSDTKGIDHRPNGNEVVIMSEDDRTSSFFSQPGILAAVIGGAVVGLLCAILVVMFIVYRMRKKDEGSYALDEPKRSPANNSYAKNANNREFYA